MTLWCIAECNQSIRRKRRCQTDQTLICRVKHETEQRRTGERARNVREQSCRIARDGNFGSLLNDLGNVRHLYVASADPFNFIGHYRALTSESRTTPTFRQRCEPLDARRGCPVSPPRTTFKLMDCAVTKRQPRDPGVSRQPS